MWNLIISHRATKLIYPLQNIVSYLVHCLEMNRTVNSWYGFIITLEKLVIKQRRIFACHYTLGIVLKRDHLSDTYTN